jgi:molybdopterin converting factor small subunit
MKRRGQVTIFVIIGIVIVVAAVAVFYLYPDILSPSTSSSPTGRIQDCLEDEIEDNVEEISLNGGSLNPELYATYYRESKKYTPEYLCYTNEYYKPCVTQQPLLKAHVEEEIKNSISAEVKKCFDNLESDYKKEGYTVSLNRNDYAVDLILGKVRVVFDYDLTLTKGSTNNYNEIIVNVDSGLQRLVNIASKILSWEAQYGDADISGHMASNYWLRAEKRKLADGSKIYILEDKESKEKFMFASRSVVWAPGYEI